MSIQNITDKIGTLLETRKIVDFKNYSDANEVYFVIEESPDSMRCNIENLKLTSIINTSNMVLYDENFNIRKFNNVSEIIDSFCKVRLHYYSLQKQKSLDQISHSIIMLQNKKRFIEEVMEGLIVINRRSYEDVEQELSEKNYAMDKNEKGFGYLLKMHVSSFTTDKIVDLEKLIESSFENRKELLTISEKQLWITHLDTLITEYNKWFTDKQDRSKKRTNSNEDGTTTKKKRRIPAAPKKPKIDGEKKKDVVVKKKKDAVEKKKKDAVEKKPIAKK